jgi:RNA polymerase primary sigma factor
MAKSFEKAVGRAPTLDELAEQVEMPRQKVATLLRIAPEPSPIDEAAVDGMIAIDERDAYAWPDPADVVNQIQLNGAVDRYISSLTTKDRKEERILRMRFGIGVGEVLTLDEIGMRFEVTRERIRQIEAKAIRKLQSPARSEPFARMVLGLEPEDNRLAPGAHAIVGDDRPNASEAVLPEPAPQRPAAIRPPREQTQRATSSKPSELDQILAKAREIGVGVDDDRLGSGRIWVELLEARDNNQRRLVRRMLSVGFALWPGKGYWR